MEEPLEIEQTQVPHPGSWKGGSCCCNCSSLMTLRKHPWNTSKFAKGPVNQKIGYVCTGGEERIATFMDSMHGMCEMYWPTEERTKYLELKKTSEKMGL